MTQKLSRWASRPAAAGPASLPLLPFCRPPFCRPPLSRPPLVLALLGLALLPDGPARAQVSWSGGTSSDWFTGSNWSGGNVPDAASRVTIDAGGANDPRLDSDDQIGALLGSGTLSLDDFAFLTITGSGGDSRFDGVLTGDGGLELTGGRLVLTGSGSVLDELVICSCGSGSIEIRGGSLYAESDTQVTGGALTVSQGGRLETLDLILQSGLTVTGAGSTVTVQGGSYLGYLGGGDVRVVNGGRLESEGGAEISSLFEISSVLVTGAGSVWDAAGTIAVGGGSFGGFGSLTVAEGGLVSTDLIAVDEGSTLKLGAGGRTGVVEALEIVNDGEIYADFTDSLTLDLPIDGTGGLVKDGSGSLTLAGANSYSDSTEVRSGSLIVDGLLLSPVSVDAAGLLGGSGLLLDGVVNAGTIAPGNSIGTLTVSGDVTFLPGSVYAVEVAPGGGASDLLHVLGEAELDGGTVRHVGLGGSYGSSATWRILTADGGVQGRFDAVESDFAFLDPSLGYDANNVYLTLARNDTAMADVATSDNREATADSIDALPAGSSVQNSVVVLSEEDALEAFDALSGELHANVAGSLLEQARLLREIPLGRLRRAAAGSGSGRQAAGAPGRLQQALAGAGDAAALPAGDAEDGAEKDGAEKDGRGDIVSWAQAFGSWGRRDGDGNAAGVDHALGGLLLGADAELLDAGPAGIWRLGLFTGYDRRALNVEDRRSSASVDTLHLGSYAGTRLGAFGLALGAAYAWHDVESERDVVFPGFAESLSAGYGASTLQLFGEASYDLAVGSVALQPFAGLAYLRGESEAFTESGGEAALAVERNDHALGYGTLGLRAATGLAVGGLPPLTVSGALGWRHAFGSLSPDGEARFEDGDAFVVQGLALERDVALVDAGLAVDLGPASRLSLSYGGEVGAGYQDHGLNLTIALRF